MEQLAEPGRIYLTEHTARLVAGFFRLEELGQFRVKGVHARVRVFALEGVGPPDAAACSTSRPRQASARAGSASSSRSAPGRAASSSGRWSRRPPSRQCTADDGDPPGARRRHHRVGGLRRGGRGMAPRRRHRVRGGRGGLRAPPGARPLPLGVHGRRGETLPPPRRGDRRTLRRRGRVRPPVRPRRSPAPASAPAPRRRGHSVVGAAGHRARRAAMLPGCRAPGRTIAGSGRPGRSSARSSPCGPP